MSEHEKKPVLLSGIQPSGNLMIGNYIGALKNWVALQEQYDCLYVLVDQHAITVRQDPKELRKRCFDFLALYIASGIDPERSTVFVQSHIPAHAELAWVLNCTTYMGELSRMTQFKEKSLRHEANINVGLFGYPILMAADILLYKTELVPVGQDQKQHLELTRDIAQRFNSTFGTTFTIPEPYIPPLGARIMSLQDPSAKMSKSDENARTYIALLDPPDVVRSKIRRAVTDPGHEIRYQEDKPGIANLMTIYSVLTHRSYPQIEKDYQGKGYSDLKADLAEVVVEFLRPLQEKYKDIRNNKAYLEDVLKRGAEVAHYRSRRMMEKVYQRVGFIPRLR